MLACFWGMKCVAFGAGTQGQLGNGNLEDSLLPSCVSLEVSGPVVDIACGGNHSLCLTACPSGLQHLFVWGLNHLQAASEHTRKSSIGDSSRPAACRDATEASATGDQPLTVRGGRGKSPGPTICSVPRQVPLPVPGVKVSRIAAGWAHTLLVTECGSLFVAGDNSFGQLGLGGLAHTAQSGFVPLQLDGCMQQEAAYVDAAGVAAAADCSWQLVDVAAGMRHSLVLLQSHMTRYGQQQQHEEASCDDDGLAMASICQETPQVQGACHTALVGFGYNRHEQLRPHSSAQLGEAFNNSHAAQSRPSEKRRQHAVIWTPCPLATWKEPTVRRLSAGGDRSAAITQDGQLLLWGRPLPDQSSLIAAAVSDQPGGASSDCTIDKQQMMLTSMQAAGSDASVAPQCVDVLELGGPATQPGQMQQQWVDVQLGWRHLVCLDAEGQVWTAGDNSLGQLGVPAATTQQHHKQTAGALQQDRLAMQRAACCSNLAGQKSHIMLHLVLLHSKSISVAAGSEHCAVVLQDGRVFTWGWGEHGQLGTGNSANSATPQLVWEGCDASGVSCGSGFSVLWSGN